jgi:hypothetical protein
MRPRRSRPTKVALFSVFLNLPWGYDVRIRRRVYNTYSCHESAIIAVHREYKGGINAGPLAPSSTSTRKVTVAPFTYRPHYQRRLFNLMARTSSILDIMRADMMYRERSTYPVYGVRQDHTNWRRLLWPRIEGIYCASVLFFCSNEEWLRQTALAVSNKHWWHRSVRRLNLRECWQSWFD